MLNVSSLTSIRVTAGEGRNEKSRGGQEGRSWCGIQNINAGGFEVSKNAEQMALPGLAIFNSAFSMVDVGILKYVVELCFVIVGMCNGYGRYSVLQCSTRFFFLSCAITPCLPASPSPPFKWDVRGSFVGKIPGKCCKARHPRGNHLKSTRQVCQLTWSYHVRCRLGLK